MGDAEDTQWLDDDERQVWLALVHMVTSLPNVMDAQLQRDAGLSHFEYFVMAVLSESPERTRRMSELAVLSNGSLSRLSHVVTRLARQGFVSRRPDPADGRTTLATLTDQGWEKVVASAPGHVATVRHVVFDQLTDTQVRQLKNVCVRIQSGLGVELPPEASGAASRGDHAGRA